MHTLQTILKYEITMLLSLYTCSPMPCSWKHFSIQVMFTAHWLNDIFLICTWFLTKKCLKGLSRAQKAEANNNCRIESGWIRLGVKPVMVKVEVEKSQEQEIRESSAQIDLWEANCRRIHSAWNKPGETAWSSVMHKSLTFVIKYSTYSRKIGARLQGSVL